MQKNETELTEIVRSAVDAKSFDDFIISFEKYNANRIQSRTFILRVHKLLALKHPDNWQRFLNTCDPSLRLSFLATSQHKSEMRANFAASPPGSFPSLDVVHLLMEKLSYRTLGRLAETCRWMRMNIKKDLLQKALERARKTHGVFTKVPSIAAGFKLGSPEGDVFELHTVKGTRFVRVVTNGVIFVAHTVIFMDAWSASFHRQPGNKKGCVYGGVELGALLSEIHDLPNDSGVLMWIDKLSCSSRRDNISFRVSVMYKDYSRWDGAMHDDLEFATVLHCSRFM